MLEMFSFLFKRSFAFLTLLAGLSLCDTSAASALDTLVQKCRSYQQVSYQRSFEKSTFPDEDLNDLLGSRVNRVRDEVGAFVYDQGAAVKAALDYVAKMDTSSFPGFYSKALIRETALERALGFIKQETQKTSNEFWSFTKRRISSGNNIYYGHLGYFILLNPVSGELSFGRKESIANLVYSSLPIEILPEEIFKTYP